jgi:hypothetical protein
MNWRDLLDWVIGFLAIVAACGMIFAVTTGFGLPR